MKGTARCLLFVVALTEDRGWFAHLCCGVQINDKLSFQQMSATSLRLHWFEAAETGRR